MDKKRLSQLYHLNREIEMLKKQIQDFDFKPPDCITDSVKGSYPEFPYTEHSITIYGIDWEGREKKLERLRNQLSWRLTECLELAIELNEYIACIEDSMMRQILSLRYVNGLPWRQVALHIGGGNTADGVRKMCERFLLEK